mgnify:CR=1 FL=1
MGLPRDKDLGQFMHCTFIETGTRRGNAIKRVSRAFSFITSYYSVELDKDTYKQAVERFKDMDNVHLWNGRSTDCLVEMLRLAPEPATIWLDAHDDEHKEDGPIPQELKIIKESGRTQDTILLDDLNQFGVRSSWGRNCSVEKATSLLKEINPSYNVFRFVSTYENNKKKKKKTTILVAQLVSVDKGK